MKENNDSVGNKKLIIPPIKDIEHKKASDAFLTFSFLENKLNGSTIKKIVQVHKGNSYLESGKLFT